MTDEEILEPDVDDLEWDDTDPGGDETAYDQMAAESIEYDPDLVFVVDDEIARFEGEGGHANN